MNMSPFFLFFCGKELLFKIILISNNEQGIMK